MDSIGVGNLTPSFDAKERKEKKQKNKRKEKTVLKKCFHEKKTLHKYLYEYFLFLSKFFFKKKKNLMKISPGSGLAGRDPEGKDEEGQAQPKWRGGPGSTQE